MTPRQKIIVLVPVLALLVAGLAYFQLFSSPLVIGVIVALYVIVSILNRRKFARQAEKKST